MDYTWHDLEDFAPPFWDGDMSVDDEGDGSRVEGANDLFSVHVANVGGWIENWFLARATEAAEARRLSRSLVSEIHESLVASNQAAGDWWANQRVEIIVVDGADNPALRFTPREVKMGRFTFKEFNQGGKTWFEKK